MQTDRETAGVIATSAIMIATALGFAYGMMVTDASPHEAVNAAGQPLGWTYPWSCCSSQDCRMATAGEVEERPEGYVIKATGEVVAYADKRIKDSPDGEFHVCAHRQGPDKDHVICLFAPPRSF